MIGPADLPTSVALDDYVPAGEMRAHQFRAMASRVGVQFGPGTRCADQAAAEVEAVFAEVERECTRFDDTSDLMRANAAGESWTTVGSRCFAALVEASRAHAYTKGLFDPRVMRVLSELGYDRSLPFADGELEVRATGARPRPRPPRAWTPGFAAERNAVRIGSEPVDLGGIGKGLAVRWAAERATEYATEFAIDAGGDCYLSGFGPEGDGWRVGVEDPHGDPATSDPVAVLAVSDSACATSSIRLRRWRASGAPAHHLIDPRTGAPGGNGLMSTTVVADDPAEAEVWSKTLFLAGASGVASAAARLNLAVLWVTDDGTLGYSSAMWPYVVWSAR